MKIDFHVFIDNLVSTIEAKDLYTAGHSTRVADLSYIIAKHMDFDEEFCEKIHIAGHLHDIGKIGIPDGILLKPGKLTRSEYEVIKDHSLIGFKILKNNPSLKDIPLIIKHHHEKFDGTGYPDQLKGDEIPIGSRIIAVADSFDAMVVSRAYKSAKTFESAIEELLIESNKQFDKNIVDIFLEIISVKEKLEDIKKIFSIV